MRMLRLHIWRAGFREKRKRTQLLQSQMKLLAAKLGFEIATKISGKWCIQCGFDEAKITLLWNSNESYAVEEWYHVELRPL